MNKLEKIIAAMLTENTGTHFLDSGGAYGRNWQRNAGMTIADFKSMPSATLEICIRDWHGKPSVDMVPNVNVFHKLTSGVLELDDRCNTFNAKPVKDWGNELNGVSDNGLRWLRDNKFSWDDRSGFNTYNWENNLSQVLQGNFVNHIDDGKYVLLQIHGGADVRGGYTDAKLFKVNDYADEYQVFDDGCGFSVEYADGDYLGISWHGEWINHDGGSLTDDQALEFANAAGCIIGGPDVIIKGDGYFDI